MKRFAAHYIFAGRAYKQHYIELDENNFVRKILPLEHEIAETVFHNGILFPVSTTFELQISTVIESLKILSKMYPEDSIFQLLQRAGFVCEDQNVPVQVFQLDGIDLILLRFSNENNLSPDLRKII